MSEIVQEILIPFFGTTLGAACVFIMGGGLHEKVQRALIGFASGVMTAASVWSLLIPAMEQAEQMGRRAFLPAVVGFWLGVLFLLVLDRTIPHLHQNSDQPEGPRACLKRTTMLTLAVALHNIPEGMAVGGVLAGWMAGSETISAAGALALSIGIAIQNFPEGAIISLPLRGMGMGKGKAFFYGVLSGAAEPVAAVLALWAAGRILPALPYLLGFAAGSDPRGLFGGAFQPGNAVFCSRVYYYDGHGHSVGMRKRTEKKTRPSSGSFFFAPEAQNLMRNKKREVKTRNGEEIDEEKISVFLSTCLFYSANVTKRRNFFEQSLNCRRRGLPCEMRQPCLASWPSGVSG